MLNTVVTPRQNCSFNMKLELTRRAHTYRSRIQRQICQAEVGCRNEAIWISILRAIENVEHLGAKLNVPAR